MQACNVADSSDEAAEPLAKSQSSAFSSRASLSQRNSNKCRPSQWNLAERNAKRKLKERHAARIAEAKESAFDFAAALRQILGDDEQPLVGFRCEVLVSTTRRRTQTRSGYPERSGRCSAQPDPQVATAATNPMRRRAGVAWGAPDRIRRCGAHGAARSLPAGARSVRAARRLSVADSVTSTLFIEVGEPLAECTCVPIPINA